MLTRDSKLLWLGLAIAIVAYLSASKPPTEWGYPEWLQAASFLLAWGSGQLGTSPLKGAPSGGVKPGRFLSVLLLIAVLGVSASCAGSIRNQIRTSALVVGDAALGIDQIEQDIARAVPPIYTSPAQAQEVSRGVLATLQAARAYERAVRAWPAGEIAVPRTVWEAQTTALQAIVQVEGILEDVPGAGKLLANLKHLRELIGG